MGDNWEERRARVAALADTNPSLHRHLTGDHPKRLLALDGGGVLGVMEVAFLEKIEALLRQRYDEPRLVLADHFDLIGGTSTGAIIATALALGKSAAEIKELYFNMVGDIFRRPMLSIPIVDPQFDGRILANKLRGELGERDLQSTDLMTGLAIVAKRMDTGSPWVLTNNPASAFWEDGDYIGNKWYKLRDVVRASTAAPFYFHPKKIQVMEGESEGLFVDGGLTPHNSPSLLLLMLANIQGYGFHWPINKDNIRLISVGCGWLRPKITRRRWSDKVSAWQAVNTLKSLTWDGQVNALKLLQWISEPRLAWPINSEVGTLESDLLGSFETQSPEMIRFQRYDVMLDPHPLREKFGPEVPEDQRERLRDFMDPKVLQEAYDLACRCAEVQVRDEDL